MSFGGGSHWGRDLSGTEYDGYGYVCNVCDSLGECDTLVIQPRLWGCCSRTWSSEGSSLRFFRVYLPLSLYHVTIRLLWLFLIAATRNGPFPEDLEEADLIYSKHIVPSE